jgi:hypothetical protein
VFAESGAQNLDEEDESLSEPELQRAPNYLKTRKSGCNCRCGAGTGQR